LSCGLSDWVCVLVVVVFVVALHTSVRVRGGNAPQQSHDSAYPSSMPEVTPAKYLGHSHHTRSSLKVFHHQSDTPKRSCNAFVSTGAAPLSEVGTNGISEDRRQYVRGFGPTPFAIRIGCCRRKKTVVERRTAGSCSLTDVMQ
jgi:hypothetical protein